GRCPDDVSACDVEIAVRTQIAGRCREGCGLQDQPPLVAQAPCRFGRVVVPDERRRLVDLGPCERRGLGDGGGSRRLQPYARRDSAEALSAAGQVDRDQPQMVAPREGIFAADPGRQMDVLAVEQQHAGLVRQLEANALEKIRAGYGSKPIEVNVELFVTE